MAVSGMLVFSLYVYKTILYQSSTLLYDSSFVAQTTLVGPTVINYSFYFYRYYLIYFYALYLAVYVLLVLVT